MKVLVTAPPMLGAINTFKPMFHAQGIEVVAPNIVQTMPENDLVAVVPEMDGWIAGDCPVSAKVLAAGKNGRLRAVVKWGVGVDNVDFGAAQALGIPTTNTPGVFDNEVADVALGYVIGLARETYWIDREVRAGRWPKPAGRSLAGASVALVGYGNIGRAIAPRLQACGMLVVCYDPAANGVAPEGLEFRTFPDGIGAADFMVLACALTASNRHLVNDQVLGQCKPGLRLVNVSRGGLIDEQALDAALTDGRVHSAALDVFADEPLPMNSPLRAFDRCVFGSHNASNTVQAVSRTSQIAFDKLVAMLSAKP